MSLNHINCAKILMDVHSSSNTCTNFSIRYFRDPIKSLCIKANESIPKYQGKMSLQEIWELFFCIRLLYSRQPKEPNLLVYEFLYCIVKYRWLPKLYLEELSMCQLPKKVKTPHGENYTISSSLTPHNLAVNLVPMEILTYWCCLVL